MPLSAFEVKATPPGRTLLLPPSVFADDWKKKPASPVCVGLRLMSDDDRTRCRAEAERIALEFHPKGGPNWIDCFNDALVRQCVALGMCDPNDVHKFSDLMELPEEEVVIAFTSSGAGFVFDAIEQYEAESSPITPEASDEDIAEFIGLVQEGSLDILSPEEHRRARRLIASMLTELRSAVTRAA